MKTHVDGSSVFLTALSERFIQIQKIQVSLESSRFAISDKIRVLMYFMYFNTGEVTVIQYLDFYIKEGKY